MIPPQLLLFAAKHSKTLILAAVFLLVLLGIKMALSYHERVVADNAELRGQIASIELAMKVETAKAEAQAGAIQRWKSAHVELEKQLAEQKAVQALASAEKERLNEILRDHDLTKLAAAKPGLVERAINRGTARMQRLLICASAGRDCDDGSNGPPALEDGATASGKAIPGKLQLDGSSAGVLPGP